MLKLFQSVRLPLSILIILIALILGFVFYQQSNDPGIELPIVSEKKEKPLDKYTFDNLSKKTFQVGEITFGNVIDDNSDFLSQIFYVENEGKRISGQINIPSGSGPFPVIVMFRGYVDREIYRTGIGTERAAEVFARNGFVTVAPDFLGYGSSDDPLPNEMEDRFHTYTTAITILRSIENLNKAISENEIDATINPKKIGLWGHSNGGQIALSLLEITGETIPTVLWAPVTKPFPYSILYYTDEFDDRGKYLRRVIAEFEQDYDAELYSIEKYFDRINAPIQLYQGTADDSVPKQWSDDFVEAMEELGKEIDYILYEGADHNLVPNGWSPAVSGAMEFYFDNFQ